MILMVDFETTGLLKDGVRDPLKQPGITQIGVVKLDHALNEIEAWETLVNPEIAEHLWDKKAIEITGLDPAKVAGAPTFFEVLPQFAAISRGARIWSGYNIDGFDTHVLKFQLQRYGYETHFPWPYEHLDVMEMAKRYLQSPKWVKLAVIYEKLFGRQFDNAHDALSDIRATAEVLRKIGKDHVNAVYQATP